jgi:hypothetical protein
MLELRIDGARWLETNDFTKSGPDDRHYVFDRESGEIHFGDGKNGAVPAAGATFNLELDVGGAVSGTVPNVYRLRVPQGGTVAIHTHVKAQDESGGAGQRAKRVGCLTAILGALAGIVAWRSRIDDSQGVCRQPLRTGSYAPPSLGCSGGRPQSLRRCYPTRGYSDREPG